MEMHDYIAHLGLWTFASHFPRALPWAITLYAVGTKTRSDCASLLWIVVTILPEQNPHKSAASNGGPPLSLVPPYEPCCFAN